jgi:hypothetical protein
MSTLAFLDDLAVSTAPLEHKLLAEFRGSSGLSRFPEAS